MAMKVKRTQGHLFDDAFAAVDVLRSFPRARRFFQSHGEKHV